MFRDKIIAAIRTGCAALGAYALTFAVTTLAGWGLEVTLDPELQTMLVGVLFAGFVAAYNLAVGWLTENVWDGFGWLLGVNKAPSYVTEPESSLPQVNGGTPWTDYTAGDPHR